MEEIRHKTVICTGDFRQMAPVVSGGDRTQTVNASITSSPLWDTFQVKHLTVNLRLRGLMDDIENMTQEEIDDLHMQQWFARTLDAIGNGNHPMKTSRTAHTASRSKAYVPLFPDGFDVACMSTRAILAVTNEAVNEWNIRIQQMNDEQTCPLQSVDRLCEVHDPNDHVKNMLTEEILHNLTTPDAHLTY
eukprot:gene30176-biopygen28883